MNTGRADSWQDTQPTDSLADFSVLAAYVLPHLNGGRIRSGKLVRWFKRRPQKLVVEVETAAPDAAGGASVRYIVKLHRGDRTRAIYEALSRLWEAGFRPPSPYTVVRPVAYIADPGLLVQEKAPGVLVRDLILRKEDGAADAANGVLVSAPTSSGC